MSDKFIASLVAASSVEFDRDIDRVDVPNINFWFDSDTQVVNAASECELSDEFLQYILNDSISGKSYLFIYLVDLFREP